jgi:hypothetical protein
MSIFKYNEFYEYGINQDLTSIDKDNVASISDNGTGIKSLILWIGCKVNNRPIIKVSNNPEDLTGKNLFSIDIETNHIIGKINKEFINQDILDKIISFININKSLIIKYTNEEIFTDELVDDLLPYNHQ